MAGLLEFEFDNKFDVELTNRGDIFASVLGQMYANEEQFDLIIKLDGGDQLPAHRHVMAIVSPEIKGMLEEELNPKGSFVKEVSEVELLHIPSNIMEKILEYVYYGSTHVCRWEIKKFCNSLNQLGFTPKFLGGDIKKCLKKLKKNDETAEMVYQNRGNFIADGFQQMLCDQNWFDITVEVDFLTFEAHRVALSVGSEYFRGMLGILPPSTMATTVEAQVNLSFEKTYNMIAFIYSGSLQLDDLADYLNAGENLEILGLRGCDDHRAEPKRGKPSNEHKIFATAKDIPKADQPLRKTDIRRKVTATTSQKLSKNAARLSSSSTSGSEYDVEKDSDRYSDSDDAMPLSTLAKHPKLQRVSKVLKKVSSQKCSNGQKRNKAISSAPKQAKAGGSQSKPPPTRAARSVPNAVSNESQGELSYTISKSDYELFMRLLQGNGNSEAVRPEPEQQIDGDVAENECDQNEYENDDILDQAVGEYQQEYADDPESQLVDNCDQNPCEYDEDETMEGAVGGSLEKYDENENELEAVDESCEWVHDNGYEGDHLVEEDEDRSTNNDSTRKVYAKGKMNVRTWTDADYVDEAEFDTSPRGATWLLQDGYRYIINGQPRQDNDYKRWQCANERKFKCSAKTKTKEIDGIEMMQQPDPVHNHPRVY